MTAIKKAEGWWPTPTVQDGKNNAGPSQFDRNSAPLNVAVMFPTSCRHDHMATQSTKAHGWQKNGVELQTRLNDTVLRMTYPTPASRDWRGADGSLHGKGQRNLNDVAALYDTPTVYGDGGSGRKGNMPRYAQLNPDWVEWLMGWLVGWTDLKCDAPRAYAIDADPATLAETDAAYVPRVTGRRDNRARRIMAIGNGQVPICAALAFSDGLAALSLEAVT